MASGCRSPSGMSLPGRWPRSGPASTGFAEGMLVQHGRPWSAGAAPPVLRGTAMPARPDGHRRSRATAGFARSSRCRRRTASSCPCDLDPEIAALTEPMTVSAEAVDTGEVRAGDRVLVLGPGSIGQGIALFAREAGAAEVVWSAVTIVPRSTACGAMGFPDVSTLASARSRRRWPRYLARGNFDVVIEATGVPPSCSRAWTCCGSGACWSCRHPSTPGERRSHAPRPRAPADQGLLPRAAVDLAAGGRLPDPEHRAGAADDHPPAAARAMLSRASSSHVRRPPRS